MIAIIDYGMGNLRSAQKAFEFIGQQAEITSDPSVLRRAERIVLPGVGAFGAAIARLRETGLDAVAREEARRGKPLLGICLGMQLLFRSSTEGGLHEGLSLIDGRIGLFDVAERIPHVGWNQVDARNGCPLLRGIDGEYFYFVHSYCAAGSDAPYTGGVTEYGKPFTSLAFSGNVYGAQFHPEKSGDAGMELLKNFVAL